jgi:D-arabinose 1-dehydrogenase-like Zn-dependent alcohol dehydrogenase
VTSRAVVLRRFGEPLVIQEFDVAPALDGGLVVASTHGGVCGTDVHLQRGHLDVPTPIVLGHEGFGVVQELGSNMERDVNGEPLHIGDHVMWASSVTCGRCSPCVVDCEPTLCVNRQVYGVNRPTTAEPALSGSWADYIHLRPGTTVVKIPDHVDPVDAMSLACAGPTILRALLDRRPVVLGDVVVVQGSGPVGLAAAVFAELAGAAEVILVGGPESRLRLAAELGIGSRHVNVVDAADHGDTLAEVAEMTHGGADLVIECTGAPEAVGEGLRLARRGGSYLVVGQYTDAGDALINPHQIVYRNLDVFGSWAFTGGHLVEYVRLLPRLLERVRLGRLVTTYPLEDHATALADVAGGRVLKAVLLSAHATDRTPGRFDDG